MSPTCLGPRPLTTATAAPRKEMAEVVKQAIRSGEVKALTPERLKEVGIGVNSIIGNEGFTPLHWACHYGRTEVLEYLLQLGADASLTTKHRWTGAHICAIRGCTECLQVLCNQGLDVTTIDDRGYTCAHLAAAHGKCSTLQAIINMGMDLSTVDRQGWTVVHHAAFHGRLGVLQFLVTMKELSLSSEDSGGNTPVHLAASEGHLDSLKLLVSHVGNRAVTSRNNNGETAKDLAVQFHKRECAKFLASEEPCESHSGVQYKYYDNTGYPAHSAASSGNQRLLSMLIQEGQCGVNDKDLNEATPAHLAAAGGHRECLQWLVDHGADMSLKNSTHETPLDIARKYAHTDCLVLLAEGEESVGGDDAVEPEALAKAEEEVTELEKLLQVARTKYQQLGGVWREEEEWKKQKEELVSQLELERERREGLEVELDRLRRQLQQATSQLEHNQALIEVAKTASNHSHGGQKAKKKSSKTRHSTGGTFVRIDHP